MRCMFAFACVVCLRVCLFCLCVCVSVCVCVFVCLCFLYACVLCLCLFVWVSACVCVCLCVFVWVVVCVRAKPKKSSIPLKPPNTTFLKGTQMEPKGKPTRSRPRAPFPLKLEQI